MGMFDYIRCKMPLPADPTPPEADLFQTKDTPTDQLWMDIWEIEADGSLVRLGYRIEDRSDKSLPKDDLRRMQGCMTKVYDAALDKAIAFHGDLSFYHYEDKVNAWWSYIARFTDGECTKIWCDEYTPPRAALASTKEAS